jgi:hypothetical protein
VLTLILNLPSPNKSTRRARSLTSSRYRMREFCVIRSILSVFLVRESYMLRISCSPTGELAGKAYSSKKICTHCRRDVASRMMLSAHDWMVKYLLEAYETALRLSVHRYASAAAKSNADERLLLAHQRRHTR